MASDCAPTPNRDDDLMLFDGALIS
jgi:hypothetical protein